MAESAPLMRPRRRLLRRLYPVAAIAGLLLFAVVALAYRQAIRPVSALWSQDLTIDASISVAAQNQTLYLRCSTGATACTVNNTTPPASNVLVGTNPSPNGGSASLGNNASVTLKSASLTRINSRKSWTVNLRITGTAVTTGQVRLWYVTPASSACGTPPAASATNYIAGASLASPAFPVGTVVVPLTAGTATTGVPASTVALCLRVDRAGGGGNVVISTTGLSTVGGPFTP
ncbi:MAG: hypothetical protein K1X87_05460 [Dehalococcoidia bacterium]|nr:hypothetical protein [Dehalococcoidia bacterium]